MLRDRLRKLFADYDPSLRQIIDEVGDIEQMHISMKRPHLNEWIDEIVERIAREQIDRADEDELEE